MVCDRDVRVQVIQNPDWINIPVCNGRVQWCSSLFHQMWHEKGMQTIQTNCKKISMKKARLFLFWLQRRNDYPYLLVSLVDVRLQLCQHLYWINFPTESSQVHWGLALTTQYRALPRSVGERGEQESLSQATAIFMRSGGVDWEREWTLQDEPPHTDTNNIDHFVWGSNIIGCSVCCGTMDWCLSLHEHERHKWEKAAHLRTIVRQSVERHNTKEEGDSKREKNTKRERERVRERGNDRKN